MRRLNKNVSQLKVGDKVTSDFIRHEPKIVRTILQIEKDSKCGSGFRIWVVNGESCSCCHRPFGTDIPNGVDGSWFIPMEK